MMSCHSPSGSSTALTLRRFDRTSSDMSDYGSATQCRDTGTWLISMGAHGFGRTSTVPFETPLAGELLSEGGGHDGVAAAAPTAGGPSGSLHTDSWMTAGLPATEGIQLPELPAQFHHGSAAEFPLLPDDDSVLFDALYGG